MSDSPHVCLFYSTGRNYLQALRELRNLEPHARICAMVPAGYPLAAEEDALADEVVYTELASYSPLNVPACLRLVRMIRAARYDRFIILFASTQLRVLGNLSGAPVCQCLSMHGHLYRMERSVTLVVLKALGRAVWGRLVYAWVWLVVHTRPVRKTSD
jgi:hypothetical protein